MAGSRYVVGIDLGTTNSAVAYFDTGEGDDPRCRVLPLPQIVRPGAVSNLPLLPSFLYLPNPGEQPVGALALPWDANRDFAVGQFARDHGVLVPTRLVASAKSWLCHAGVDRRSPILPWKGPPEGRKVSPLEAITRYMKHLVESWNAAIAKDLPDRRLELQEIVLTVPASFDAAARDLTVEAARAAGLQQLTLLEEPQAAFYSWLESSENKWREQVRTGDCILVADVGGGTSDFTLIRVEEDRGNLTLTRLAVGDHLLLGGDNMDLALAALVAEKLKSQNVKLDLGQLMLLSHSARQAKEKLLSDPSLTTAPVTVLGRGSKVIGGTIKGELLRTELDQLLLEGFFPACSVETEPNRQRSAGLQELGLPYVADTAITKHLASFLTRQGLSLGGIEKVLPTAVLFNGGVFLADGLRNRLLEVLGNWSRNIGKPEPRVLEGTDLDLAVARGAASFGLVRRGKGIRIRGGTARSYYVGIETSLPPIPGFPPPIKALCVAPFGMEEGTETDLPKQEFGLIVGEPVTFRFLSSSTRRQDQPGIMIEDWDSNELQELNPIQTTLEGDGSGKTVPVHLHARVNEIGLLELSFVSRDSEQRWALSFNVRES
jgi:hypothetical protein